MQQPHINSTELTISKLFNLKGKVALITGCSGALGMAVAKGLAVNGVNLVLSSVEEEALQKLAGEIRGTLFSTPLRGRHLHEIHAYKTRNEFLGY